MDTFEIVVVIIINPQGDFFIHQRSEDKKTFPNLYGLGVGGHIKAEEDHKLAALRELKEESGLETPVKYLFSINYQPETGPRYNVFVYETIIAKQKIKTHLKEWQWSGWMSKDSLDKLLKENKLCPDTAIFYTKYIQKYLSQKRD